MVILNLIVKLTILNITLSNSQKIQILSRAFSKIDHSLDHKAGLHEYKRIQITPSLFFILSDYVSKAFALTQPQSERYFLET